MSNPALMVVCPGGTTPVGRRARDPMGIEMTDNGLQAVFMARRTVLERFLRARGAGADVEDILQDIWLKLQAIDPGPIAEPLSYLYRMADNQLLDRVRETKRRARREEVWGDSFDQAGQHAENGLIAKEGLQVVDETLSTLGERTYSILYRYRIDGQSQKDIARELGVSLSLVEKHLQRAYRALLALKRDFDADAELGQHDQIGGTDV